MAKNVSLPAFQYEVVNWWKKHTDGKLPKGNEFKHLVKQNIMVANRLSIYAMTDTQKEKNEEVKDELALMFQNIALLAYCSGLDINDIYEAAMPDKED